MSSIEPLPDQKITIVKDEPQVVLVQEAVGPAGRDGIDGDKTFVWTQWPASDTWDIYHGMAKHPSVTVVDSAGSVIEPDVEYMGTNRVILHFNGATAGTAYLN